jgi:soluble lytic murein transglycosylase
MLIRHRFPLVIWLLGAIGAALAPAQAATLSASDKSTYIAAFTAVEDNKWPEAEAIAARAKDPLLAKVVLWLNLLRRESGHSFYGYAAFMAENPDWPSQATLQAQAELAMPLGLPPQEILAWFRGREPLTFAGTMQLARALQATGDAARATEIIRRGWVRLDATESEEKALLGRYGKLLRTEDHLARLDRLLWDNRQDAARRMAARVDAGHRALAEARLALRNGKGNVDQLIARVPKSLQRDAGLVYERARWRRRNGYEDTIPDLFTPPLTAVSRPDLLWREIEAAARGALARGQHKTAYRLAIQHGAGDGTAFAEGEWLAGWIALRFLHDPKTAYVHFTNLYGGVSSPISKSRGAYWSGRAAEALKNSADAQRWYAEAAKWSTTYYGQLAAQRSGHHGPLVFPTVPEPTQQQRAEYFNREMARVVQQLHEIDRTDRAKSFLLRLVELATSPAEHHLVADLAAALGRADLSVAAAKASRFSGVELVDHLFPMLPVQAGESPERALILAVIRQESAFQLDAVSSAGALGLMQLMPATAKAVAKKMGLPYAQARLTSDSNYNISLGRFYLDGLIDRFGGSYVLAVAGYNAGPGRVNEWLAKNRDPRRKDVDTIDWIESIPFSETRNYVQRVIENLQVYRQRLGGTQIAVSIEQDLAR